MLDSLVYFSEEWDLVLCAPLLSTQDTKQFELSGPENRLATRVGSIEQGTNVLMTTTVMHEGKHQISFRFTRGDDLAYNCGFGLVRDGTAWDKNLTAPSDTATWIMFSSEGALCGNGKSYRPKAGAVKNGQIVSIEADLDKGTLRFWLDGKVHGPGWSSGVTGRLRWATFVQAIGDGVQIVHTPELQPWTPWIGIDSDSLNSDEESSNSDEDE